MFESISNKIKSITFILLLLSVAVLAREVIVVGNNLVAVKTVTELCNKPDCCSTFYQKYNGNTYIINAPLVTTIETTSYNAAWSYTPMEMLCSITLILDDFFTPLHI